MEFRSTNTKYKHLGGDLVTNVDDGSSYGVHLTGGSTGGIVTAAGDTTNINLVLRPKGAGALVAGNSSTPMDLAGSSVAITSTHVNINSSRIVLGASTTPLILMQRSRIQFTIPALSSGPSVDESVAVTVTGLTTNAMIFIQQRVPYNSTDATGVEVDGYCSTAGDLRLRIKNLGGSTLSGSTASAYLWRLECPVAV